MTTHSVADARNHLSQLIDRALEGEEVVITRHGRPVVRLRRVDEAPGPVTLEELDWLATRRVGGQHIREDAGTATSRMRDEEER
jgi:prevent-host-death family protein